MDKLQGVSDALFIPLAARIFVSKKFHEYFFDEKALSLEQYIPDDTIQKSRQNTHLWIPLPDTTILTQW
jgi:O-methyltransferase involved in polyketide biosynthesis